MEMSETKIISSCIPSFEQFWMLSMGPSINHVDMLRGQVGDCPLSLNIFILFEWGKKSEIKNVFT